MTQAQARIGQVVIVMRGVNDTPRVTQEIESEGASRGTIDVPGIVNEVGRGTVCVALFPARRSPMTVMDIPFFGSRREAVAWLESQSVPNQDAAYPVAPDLDLPTAEQVNDEADRNLDEIRKVVEPLHKAADGACLPPITGELRMSLGVFEL